MATTAIMGHQALMSFNGTAMEFNSLTLKKTGTLMERDGIRGTRSRNINDVRTGPYGVGGNITMEPSAANLNAIMVLALGSAGAVAETLTSFSVIVDRETNIITYEGCVVNTATLRGSSGSTIELSVDLVGKTANTTGTVAAPTIAIPFIFADCVLTLGNTAYETMDFILTVNNNLVTDRFANALTLTDIPAGERLVTLQTTHSYTNTNAALWDIALAGPSAPNTLAIGNGANTVTFTFGALQAAREDPDVSKSELLLVKNWTARKTGNTNEIAVALT